MRIVFYTKTPLAGMPQRTARVLDLHDDVEWARCVVARPTAYGTRVFEAEQAGPYLQDGTPDAHESFEDCDVIIVPSYVHDMEVKRFGKPIVRHYSTEQSRWVEKDPDPSRSSVVAQYQARFAPRLTVLPNCIPIDDPPFMPAEKPLDRVVCVYSPSSKSGHGWARKGYPETMEALRKLKTQFRDEFEPVFLMGRPYSEVLRAKRHAHIVIDEVATGSYHSNALEGISCGALTISWIDRETQSALERMYQTSSTHDPSALASLPIVSLGQMELQGYLETMIQNRAALLGSGRMTRKWTCENYSVKMQGQLWLDWLTSCLQTCAPK